MSTDSVNGHTLPVDGNWSDGYSAEKAGITAAARVFASAIDSDGDIDAGDIDVRQTIGTFNSTTAGSGLALDRTTNTATFRVYSDDGGVVLTGTGSVPDIRGSISRVLLTKDNSGGHVRVFGLQGMVKGYDAEWATEQVAASQGLLELIRNAGTRNLQGYGKTSALLGTVSTSGALTVDANHLVAGVLALSNIRASFTMTGKVAAFAADIYDATNWSDGTARQKWPWGLYIPARAADSGISVGDFASSYATGSGLVHSASITGIVRAYSESTSDLTSAYNCRTLVARHLVVTSSATVNHETYGAIGQLCVKNTSLGHYHGGVMGSFETNTAATILTSYGVGAVIGRVGAESTTINSGGLLAAVLALQNTTTITATGTYAAFAAKCAAGKSAFPYGIYLGNQEVARVLYAGSSSSPVTCDTADTKFVQIYADCGATSGDNRGIYNRLYLTSTGGGESLRSYTDISGTVGTAHGSHISLGFGESTSTGAVTGLGVAGRFTLGLANIAYPGTGTLAVVQAEVYSFGSSSDPAGNAIAMLNIGNHGDATGAADVDDDAVLMHLSGWTSADGNMVVKAGSAGAMANCTWTIRCKMPDGSLAYLPFVAAAVAA